MSNSTRYKFVRNNTANVLTIDNFKESTLTLNDGDDRPTKIVKRVITAADIGTNPGQIGHVYGAIVDVIGTSSNVLWMEMSVTRVGSFVQQGMTPYQSLDGDIPAYPATIQTQLMFGFGLDGTIRAIDKTQGTAAAIADGDIITAKIVLGYPQSPLDVMNP